MSIDSTDSNTPPGDRAEARDFQTWVANRNRRRVAPSQDQRGLHGDLRDRRLAEVFVEIVGSGQDGVLRVGNSVEHHDLYFRNGMVQVFAPHRSNMRLGERLVHMGLLTQAALDDALEFQGIMYQPLGRILLDRAQVTQADIDRVVEYQIAEDLYSLFAWPRGHFEFLSEEPDAEMAARLEVLPAFELTNIVVEVHRRAGQWDRILQTLGSIDEVFVALPDCEALPEEAEVFAAMDGSASVRELSESLILSLFDCARIAADLLDRRIVKRLDVSAMTELAARRFEAGESREVVLILETLLDRSVGGLDDPEQAQTVAALLTDCNAPRLAAEAIVCAARVCADPERAVDLAREASELDSRSVAALRVLEERLWATDPDGDEAYGVSCRLADALFDSGSFEEALSVIEQMEERYPEELDTINRKIRVLHRLDRGKETATCMLVVAESMVTEGERERAVSLYRQILHFDPHNREAISALRELEANWLLRHWIKLSAGAAAVIVVGLMGLALLQSSAADIDTGAVLAKAERMLAAGDTRASLVIVDQALAEVGSNEGLEALRVRIQRRANQDASLARRNEKVQEGDLQSAREHVRQGGLGAALGVLRKLQTEGFAVTRLQLEMAPAFAACTERLEQAGDQVEELVSIPEDVLESMQRREQVVIRLDEGLFAAETELAGAALELSRDATLVELLTEQERERLTSASERFLGLHGRATAIRDTHQRAKELDRFVAAAQRHVDRFEFGEALAAYRHLAENYPYEGEAKELFRDQAARCQSIQVGLESVGQATAGGDFETALAGLAWLRQRDPRVPFETLVRLPLRVSTLPPGAAVLVNGEREGQTPLLTSYAPTDRVTVRLELKGFEVLETEFAPDRGALELALARRPDWTWGTKGSVQHRPVCDDAGRVFVADRSGRLTALDLRSGEELWSFESGDISGLLPSPVWFGEQVIFGSVDGKVRSVSRTNGALRWERSGIACESDPALVGSTLVLATNTGELVGLDVSKNGAVLYRVELPGPVRTALRVSGTDVVLATTNGRVIAASAVDGSVRWQSSIGGSCAHGPVVAGEQVVAAADDGQLFVLRLADGSPLWRRHEQAALSAGPAVAGPLILLPDGDLLRSFELSGGKPGPVHRGPGRWSAPPVHVGDLLFAGSREAVIEVLDAQTLELRYVIKGVDAGGPVVAHGDRLVVGFEGRMLMGFPR